MRPLPPYTVRPVKRSEEPRHAVPAGTVRELAGTLADEMSVRSGRLRVKPAMSRERPRLRVLARASE